MILSSSLTMAQEDYARPQPEQYAPVSGSTDDKRFNIGLSLGSAIPMNKFASTSVKNTFWDFTSADSTHLEGFARNGFNFTLTASYLFPGNFGIILMFGSCQNPFDINTFSAKVGLPSTSPSASYNEDEYLVGGFGSFPVDKFRFTVNALVGLVSMGYPEISCAAHDTTYTYDLQGGSGFGYDLGGSAEYDISSRIAVSVNINYLGSNVQYNGFSITGSTPTSIGYFSSTSDVLSLPTGILKITIGAVLRF
jgi:hypothetical protein